MYTIVTLVLTFYYCSLSLKWYSRPISHPIAKQHDPKNLHHVIFILFHSILFLFHSVSQGHLIEAVFMSVFRKLLVYKYTSEDIFRVCFGIQID